MKTLDEAWQDYRQKVLSKLPPPLAEVELFIRQFKSAFMAGAISVALVEAEEEEIFEELRQYAEDLRGSRPEKIGEIDDVVD